MVESGLRAMSFPLAVHGAGPLRAAGGTVLAHPPLRVVQPRLRQVQSRRRAAHLRLRAVQ